ncbi:unnamed protein product, partial [Allacma fusca]
MNSAVLLSTIALVLGSSLLVSASPLADEGSIVKRSPNSTIQGGRSRPSGVDKQCTQYCGGPKTECTHTPACTDCPTQTWNDCEQCWYPPHVNCDTIIIGAFIHIFLTLLLGAAVTVFLLLATGLLISVLLLVGALLFLVVALAVLLIGCLAVDCEVTAIVAIFLKCTALTFREYSILLESYLLRIFVTKMKKSRKSPHVRTTYSNVKSNETFNCNTNPSASTSKSLNITTKKRSQVNESTVLVIKPKEKSNNFPKSSSRLIVDTTPDPTEECEDEHRSTSNVPVTNLPNSNTNNNWLRELSRKKMLPEALHQSELPVVPTKVSKMSGDCNKIVHHLEEELTVLKDVNIREENYQIPNKSLREVFEYLGHKYEIRNGVPITSNSTSIQAKCLICLKVYSYQSPSTGGVSNLIRHLKKYHPDKGAELEKKEAASEEKSRDIMHSWFRSKQKSKYHPSDHQQTKFNKALLYCIAKDKLPMSLGNGKGFSNLMSTIDPKLSIPSRSTVQRRFKQEHEKNVIPSLKQVLKSMGKGIISLDSWKSRRKDGILAFKFHCIDNSWSVRNLTLGIREINESQTGDTIRKHFDDLIDELNIRDKVAMVMTDSGANMVKAFKAPISKTAIEEHFDSESDDEIQVDDEVPDDEIIIYCESENENDEDSNEFTANSDTDSFS